VSRRGELLILVFAIGLGLLAAYVMRLWMP
jgi:hypothetical protein